MEENWIKRWNDLLSELAALLLNILDNVLSPFSVSLEFHIG